MAAPSHNPLRAAARAIALAGVLLCAGSCLGPGLEPPKDGDRGGVGLEPPAGPGGIGGTSGNGGSFGNAGAGGMGGTTAGAAGSNPNVPGAGIGGQSGAGGAPAGGSGGEHTPPDEDAGVDP